MVLVFPCLKPFQGSPHLGQSPVTFPWHSRPRVIWSTSSPTNYLYTLVSPTGLHLLGFPSEPHTSSPLSSCSCSLLLNHPTTCLLTAKSHWLRGPVQILQETCPAVCSRGKVVFGTGESHSSVGPAAWCLLSKLWCCRGRAGVRQLPLWAQPGA